MKKFFYYPIFIFFISLLFLWFSNQISNILLLIPALIVAVIFSFNCIRQLSNVSKVDCFDYFNMSFFCVTLCSIPIILYANAKNFNITFMDEQSIFLLLHIISFTLFVCMVFVIKLYFDKLSILNNSEQNKKEQ